MGQVKNWLMEMQEYSYHLLDRVVDKELTYKEAKENFVAEYGNNQEDIFTDVTKEYEEHEGEI
jgi:hypothetical protein|tara:strand:+ start:144 stop:332 length:189 start_codon:yes stop_codon:yes gene_type:complete